MLGAGPGDAGRVRFLEGVVADEVRRHLAGQADDGDAVHERVGEAGHRIGRAGPGGHEHDADLAGRAGVAFRGMNRAAFLADEVMAQPVLLEDLVIDRQHGAARIAEDRLDTLIDEGFDDHFGAVHGPDGHGPIFRIPGGSATLVFGKPPVNSQKDGVPDEDIPPKEARGLGFPTGSGRGDGPLRRSGCERIVLLFMK